MNNSGAFGIALKLGMTYGGLPSYGFLDTSKGKESLEKRLVVHDIGFGDDPASVKSFLDHIRQAAPTISSADIEALRKAPTRS